MTANISRARPHGEPALSVAERVADYQSYVLRQVLCPMLRPARNPAADKPPLYQKESIQLKDVQEAGGTAALILAATFVFGFVIYFAVILGSGFESSDPVEAVGFLSENQTLLTAWYLVIYIVFGIALVVLSVALNEQLKDRAPAMAQTATAFGLIWAGLVIASGMIAVVGMDAVIELYGTDRAQAGTIWAAIETVQVAIGGGIEVVGALWILLIGWAALRIGTFSRRLGYVSVVIGTAGVVTIVPALEVFGALFGLGSIIWFVWVGIVMLRSHQSEPGLSPLAA